MTTATSRLLHLLFGIALAAVLAESAARLVLGGEARNRAEYVLLLDRMTSQLQRDRVNQAVGLPQQISDQNFQHPFRGFVPRPDVKRPCGPGYTDYMCVIDEEPSINHLGLYAGELPKRPTGGSVRIGVTGGSVANLLMQTSRLVLEKQLERSPLFRGKDVELVNLAVPGYKQPQQFYTIMLLLATGYYFHAVVDLAGLNEVYLSRHYNIQQNASYAFPFVVAWQPATPPVSGESLNARYPAVFLAAQNRLAAAVAFAPRGVLASSAFVRVVAMTLLRWEENKLREARVTADGSTPPVDQAASAIHRYMLGSLDNTSCADPDCTEERVLLWSTLASSMHHALAASGVRYFEVLQPNHYVVPVAAVSLADRAKMSVDFGWSASDTRAWIRIRNTIPTLRAAGIRAADLSEPFPFSNVTGGVLVDACCHLTRTGYDILAAKLATVIVNDWSAGAGE